MTLQLQIVPLGHPDEVRTFPHGRFELYRVGTLELGRAVYEAGWRWSEHVRPIAGTELCEVDHVGFVVSGSAGVRMADGTERVLRSGSFFAIPPGHDSWVVGDEEYVSLHLSQASSYASSSKIDVEDGPDLETPSEFMRLLGLRFDELGPLHVAGHVESGQQHHQPWGLVHGGVYASVIETAATTGAYLRAREQGQLAVGVSNATDFVRSHRSGRLSVVADPVHQGRTGQLWTVQVTRVSDDKLVARGNVRVQHVDGHGSSTPSIDHVDQR
jgi:1,4-dihydroxy-2-naphthoyl-CoA hydrolase